MSEWEIVLRVEAPSGLDVLRARQVAINALQAADLRAQGLTVTDFDVRQVTE